MYYFIIETWESKIGKQVAEGVRDYLGFRGIAVGLIDYREPAFMMASSAISTGSIYGLERDSEVELPLSEAVHEAVERYRNGFFFEQAQRSVKHVTDLWREKDFPYVVIVYGAPCSPTDSQTREGLRTRNYIGKENVVVEEEVKAIIEERRKAHEYGERNL